MPLQGYLVGATSSGIVANLGTTDDVVVGTQATLISGTNAIQGLGSGQTATIFGSVYGTSSGIYLGSSTSTFAKVIIAASGQVVGESTAVSLHGSGSYVANSGQLIGTSWGLYLDTTGTNSNTVANHGSILAYSGIGVYGNEYLNFTNTGRVESTSYALYAVDTVQANVVNRGVISGDMRFGALSDTVRNVGEINGRLYLGDGNDQVIIKGVQDGEVSLGDGNDSTMAGHRPRRKSSSMAGLATTIFSWVLRKRRSMAAMGSTRSHLPGRGPT